MSGMGDSLRFNPEPVGDTLAERLGATEPGVMPGRLVLTENGEVTDTFDIAAIVDDDGSVWFQSLDGRIQINPEPDLYEDGDADA